VTGVLKEKVSELGEQTREKFAQAKERAGEKLQAAKRKAVELGGQVKEKAGIAYDRTRERVVTTADRHPLETGLACLAGGLIVGLLLPTPEPVNRVAGPTADRLRARARQAGTEALDKGKRVARAAVDAAKREADAQGLSPDRLKQSAQAVAQSATEAGGESARREGVPDDLLPGAEQNAAVGGKGKGANQTPS
jgi:hypothetical protein